MLILYSFVCVADSPLGMLPLRLRSGEEDIVCLSMSCSRWPWAWRRRGTRVGSAHFLPKRLPAGEIVALARDIRGNCTLPQDADSHLTFAYDTLGRVTQADTAATAAQPASTREILY